MDKAAVVDDGDTNGDNKEDEEDECLFDSDSSLPEIPDAPSTPVERRKFSAEQIFKFNSVLLFVCVITYAALCITYYTLGYNVVCISVLVLYDIDDMKTAYIMI